VFRKFGNRSKNGFSSKLQRPSASVASACAASSPMACIARRKSVACSRAALFSSAIAISVSEGSWCSWFMVAAALMPECETSVSLGKAQAAKLHSVR
jgi:hypothetical protein